MSTHWNIYIHSCRCHRNMSSALCKTAAFVPNSFFLKKHNFIQMFWKIHLSSTVLTIGTLKYWVTVSRPWSCSLLQVTQTSTHKPLNTLSLTVLVRFILPRVLILILSILPHCHRHSLLKITHVEDHLTCFIWAPVSTPPVHNYRHILIQSVKVAVCDMNRVDQSRGALQ